MRPDMNLTMGAFVVMPNHFHAIIEIGKNEYNSGGANRGYSRDAMHCVPTIAINNQSFSSKSFWIRITSQLNFSGSPKNGVWAEESKTTNSLRGASIIS